MRIKPKGADAMRQLVAFAKLSLRLILKLLDEGRYDEAKAELQKLLTDL